MDIAFSFYLDHVPIRPLQFFIILFIYLFGNTPSPQSNRYLYMFKPSMLD